MIVKRVVFFVLGFLLIIRFPSLDKHCQKTTFLVLVFTLLRFRSSRSCIAIIDCKSLHPEVSTNKENGA